LDLNIVWLIRGLDKLDIENVFNINDVDTSPVDFTVSKVSLGPIL
jgi:hypothetical protein